MIKLNFKRGKEQPTQQKKKGKSKAIRLQRMGRNKVLWFVSWLLSVYVDFCVCINL